MNNSFRKNILYFICALLSFGAMMGCHDRKASLSDDLMVCHVLETDEVNSFLQDQLRVSDGIAFVSTNNVPPNVYRTYVAFMRGGGIVHDLVNSDSVASYGRYMVSSNGWIKITMSPGKGVDPYSVKFFRNGDNLFMLNGPKFTSYNEDEIYCDGVYRFEGDAIVKRFWEKHAVYGNKSEDQVISEDNQ